MVDHDVPHCPCCGSNAIGFQDQHPPQILCTGCSLKMSGSTYDQALDNWTRRGGRSRYRLTCTGCDYQTAINYHSAGQTCLCGGEYVYEEA